MIFDELNGINNVIFIGESLSPYIIVLHANKIFLGHEGGLTW